MNFYANPEKIGHTLSSLTDNVYIIHRVLTTRLKYHVPVSWKTYACSTQGLTLHQVKEHSQPDILPNHPKITSGGAAAQICVIHIFTLQILCQTINLTENTLTQGTLT